MTVIAAVKKNDEVWIGADSFLGSMYNSVPDHINSSKIIRFKNFEVGSMGTTLLKSVMNTLSREDSHTLEPKYRMDSLDEALSFSVDVFKHIKERYDQGIVGKKEEEFNGGFIIASPHHLFSIYEDMSGFETECFLTKGAGWVEAKAAIHCLYDLIDSPEEILTRALTTTCITNPMCRTPLNIMKVM